VRGVSRLVGAGLYGLVVDTDDAIEVEFGIIVAGQSYIGEEVRKVSLRRILDARPSSWHDDGNSFTFERR